jgi:coatomer protein complex subunit gamma
VSVLQLFLNSPKATLRFTAVRILNKVAQVHHAAVSACNLDLEGLISDSNRSVSTLAITTLLKTGSESSVDRLMKQISSFMAEIADEFKVVVVDAIRVLCIKFPKKHRTFMTFLANALREEGGFDFKRAIVETVMVLMREIPEAWEVGLPNLCEFIEDCEFTSLSCQIIHVIGEEGPRSANPSKFIRYLYNRIMLENATVRASATAALGKFGLRVPSLRESVVTLLKRCLYDADDEVRDRARFYLSVLGSPDHAGVEYVDQPLPVPLSALQREVEAYLKNPSPALPFELANVSVRGEDIARERKIAAAILSAGGVGAAEASAAGGVGSAAGGGGGGGGGAAGAAGGGAGGVGSGGAPDSPSQGGPGGASGGGSGSKRGASSRFAQELASIPQFAGLGTLVKSAATLMLTEAETEYVVRCIKHIFPEHVVLQFDVTNTLEDQVLAAVQVAVDLTASGGSYAIESVIPVGELRANAPASTYVCLRCNETSLVAGTFSAMLKFHVKDVDPSTGGPEDGPGYPDEYPLEDFEIGTVDFMVRGSPGAAFGPQWESIGEANQLVETFALSQFKTIAAAVATVVEFLGLEPHDGSGQVPDKAKSHTLTLSGSYMGEVPVAVKALFADIQGQITMELAVRSGDMGVSELIAATVG